ncbi:hypothetical protein D3C80_1946790 [compost metagenome]
MINTPMKPKITAIHWPRVTCSPSNGTDNAVTSTGARKLTAVASASGIYNSAVVKNRLVPSRHNARANCHNGRLVRSTRSPERGRKIPAINNVCTT